MNFLMPLAFAMMIAFNILPEYVTGRFSAWRLGLAVIAAFMMMIPTMWRMAFDWDYSLIFEIFVALAFGVVAVVLPAFKQ